MKRRTLFLLFCILFACQIAAGCSVVPVATFESMQTMTEITSGMTTATSETGGRMPSDTTAAMTPAATTAQTTAADPTATPSPSPTPRPTPTRKPTPTPYPPSPYYLYAEKGSFTLAVYGRDSAGKYTRLVRVIRMAIGRSSMTPSGKFTITTHLRWKTFGGSAYAQYAVQYKTGLYIHSPVYYSKDNTEMKDYTYLAIGTKDTSGCLRIPSADAYWIYQNCPAGTVLEIVSGSPRGLSPPDLVPIYRTGQDPTDPGLPPPPTPNPVTPTPTSGITDPSASETSATSETGAEPTSDLSPTTVPG